MLTFTGSVQSHPSRFSDRVRHPHASTGVNGVNGESRSRVVLAPLRYCDHILIRLITDEESGAMVKQPNVFLLWQNMEDYNRTRLHNKLNADIDWGLLRHDPLPGQPPLELRCTAKSITAKDLVEAPGCVGLLSERLQALLSVDSLTGFAKNRVTINGEPYLAISPLTRIDCIDREQSQITELGSEELWQIDRHSFVHEKVPTTGLFCIPNTDALYCGDEIGRAILQSGLRLQVQPLVYEEADPRTRVMYDNPIVGIRFEEPANWALECKQASKLRLGSSLPASAWKLTLSKEDDTPLFSLRRFQLLQSDNWLQKAEFHAAITTRSSEDIFRERDTQIPVVLDHPDGPVEARTNEYRWQTVVVRPVKTSLSAQPTNLVFLLIYRYEGFEQDPIDLFQAMRFSK